MKIRVTVLWLILLGGISSAYCQETTGKANEQTGANSQVAQLSAETIGKEIQATEKLIKAAQTTDVENAARQIGISLADFNSYRAGLQELKLAYEGLLAVLKDRATLIKEETFLQDKIKTNHVVVPEKPPYSLSFYDQIGDQLNNATQQKESAELGERLAESALEDANSRLAQAHGLARKLKEQIDQGKQSQDLPKLKWQLTRRKLDEKLAQVALATQKLKLANLKKEIQISTLNINIFKQELRWVRQNLHFNPDDLQNQLDNFEKKKNQLQQLIKKLMSEQGDIERAWLQAQKALVEAKSTGKASPAAVAFLATRAAWRTTYQRVLEQTQDMLLLFSRMETVWKRRYQLIAQKVDTTQLDSWEKTAEDNIQSIDRTLTLQNSYQMILQSQIASLQQKISTGDIGSEAGKYIDNQIAAFQKLAARRFEYISALLTAKKLNQRLIGEIGSKRRQVSIWQKISTLASKTKIIWNAEVWVINDHSVTVHKLAVAIIILLAGIFLLKYFVRLLKKRLLPKAHMEASAAAALEKILYYCGLMLIFLLALRIVNIPLTAFTFLGGAVAIGVGFGAQNLINNFISGFILLTERPIRIGDLIEVEGKLAKVQEVGTRCTKIRTGSNLDILVPNSSFLEKNITNWTLSNHQLRVSITVGVAYGSPVREVQRLLLKVAAEHRRTLKDPEPFVVFDDFGNSALIFQVYFWVMVIGLMDSEKIKSDIRFRIDELFREAGITIAFPQMDIHMDTLKPLQVAKMDSRR